MLLIAFSLLFCYVYFINKIYFLYCFVCLLFWFFYFLFVCFVLFLFCFINVFFSYVLFVWFCFVLFFVFCFLFFLFCFEGKSSLLFSFFYLLWRNHNSKERLLYNNIKWEIVNWYIYIHVLAITSKVLMMSGWFLELFYCYTTKHYAPIKHLSYIRWYTDVLTKTTEVWSADSVQKTAYHMLNTMTIPYTVISHD